MDSIEKKVLISIDLDISSAKTALDAFKSELDNTNSTLNLNATALKQAKQANQELADELIKGKIEQQNVKTAIDKARLAQIEANAATKASKQAIEGASGSYKEAQQSLTKLGNAIKAAEGGFTSTSPKIRAQIKEYNELNSKLKAFDASMGNHQRKVGQYENSLNGLEGILTKLIPSFGQFSSVLKSASQVIGFMPTNAKKAEGGITSMANSFGNAAIQSEQATIGFKNFQTGATATAGATEEAEIATEGLSGAMVGIAAAAAAVVVGLVAVISYLGQYATYSDGAAGAVSGLKSGWNAFMNSLADKDFSNFFSNISDATNQASLATIMIKDLDRQLEVSKELTQSEDAQVRNLMLKMRDRATDAATAEKYFQTALKITGDQYERNHKQATDYYKATVSGATAGEGLKNSEIKSLMDLSQGYDVILKKVKDLVDADKLSKNAIDEIGGAMSRVIAVDAQKENRDQLLQNRNDQKRAKAEAYAEKEKQLQEEISRATEQANSERITSIAKMVEYQQEAFGKELSITDEHYRQLIFKQQEFIKKQQSIANNKKHTNKTRNAANGAMAAGYADIAQIQKERYAEIEKITVAHNKIMLDVVSKGALDLKSIEISNIKDEHKRELATIENNFQEKLLLLKQQNAQLQDNVNKLGQKDGNGGYRDGEITAKQAQVNNPNNTASQKAIYTLQLQALKTELNAENELIAQNGGIIDSMEAQKRKAIIDTNNKYEDQNNLINDQIKLLQDKNTNEANRNPFKGNSQKTQDDQIQQILDEETQELNAANMTEAKKQLIIAQSQDKIDDIIKQHLKTRQEFELNTAKSVSDAGFAILEQSFQRGNQAQEVNLQRQQAHDLQNTALTNTQKYQISEKYRIKEGQQKVKEFNQQKEIDLAKAAISGALAIIAAEEQPYIAPFVIPEILITTALNMAEIAAQKAPAYAKGGIHYVSDGTGGVLPGYSNTDNLNAHLRSGEGIVVSEAMQNPWARSVVSAINQSWGGRAFDNTVGISHFASGGVFNNYIPTSDNGLRPQIISGSNRMHGDDIGAIVGGISSAIATMPPAQVDVKDINYANSRLSGVYDRLNY